MNDKYLELRARRDELRQRLKAIHADYRQGLSADLEEQAVQLENAETLSEIARLAQLELDEVEKKIRSYEHT